jgi:DNA polymerase I-like protein with 3'-5' exonuclease and polymerase domains
MTRKGYAISESQVKAIQSDMFRLFTKWAKHRQLLVQLGTKRGWIANAFGRRRYFYMRSQAPAMVGFDPQSGVADMLWRVLPEVDSVTTLLATIHDSVVIEAPANRIEREVEQTKEIMEQEFPEVWPGFRVPVGVKIGKPGESWGDMELRYEEEEKNGSP